MEVFYISICGFIRSGKFLYETRVLDTELHAGPNFGTRPDPVKA